MAEPVELQRPQPSALTELQARDARLERVFVLVATAVLFFSAAPFPFLTPDPLHAITTAVALLIFVVAFIIAYVGRAKAGGRLLVYGICGAVWLVVVFGQVPIDFGFEAYAALLFVAGFMMSRREVVAIGAVGCTVPAIGHITYFLGGPVSASNWADYYGQFYPTLTCQQAVARVVAVNTLYLLSATVIVYILSRHQGQIRQALQRRLSRGEGFFDPLPEASSLLQTASREINVMTKEQNEGALRQASAVEETRKALQSQAASSSQIVEAAQEALSNADTTVEDVALVDKHIRALSDDTNRITELLASMKNVARESDLLALNASLQGTKAGEAGKGFSLVAKQTRDLAEKIALSVADIKELTTSIRAETNASRIAMEAMDKLAHKTNTKAREITAVTRQQRSAIQQVSGAMDDIAEITGQVVTGAQETMSATEDLETLARALNDVVGRHQASLEQGN